MKKTTKKPSKEMKEIRKKFLSTRKAITLLGPGKFKFCVARVIDANKSKIETIAKFTNVLDAGKFCDMLNK